MQPYPLLATKLYIPPARPEWVSRPRLIERLNASLQTRDAFSRALTLISAPAGFGKTTLVSEWVHKVVNKVGAQHAAPLPTAWLSLDEGDNDPTRFLAYVIAALQTIEARIGEGALSALQSPEPPPAEAVLITLINEVAAIPGRILLVLDDHHTIDSPPVDDALAFLLERLPPQMHLVIATREDPHLPLARLRARGQLCELRAADLRFTSSEAAEFLNRVMGLDLSAGDIAALESRTEGWIAGLQLAALALQGLARQGLATQGRKDASSLIKSFSGSHRFVLDYLIEEVLQQQPEPVRTFLLQTSILDRLCGPLCDAVRFGVAESPSTPAGSAVRFGVAESPSTPGGSAVRSGVAGLPGIPAGDAVRFGMDETPTGQEDGKGVLEALERGNLFVVPLDDKRQWYRYHHLFADVLQAHLMEEQPHQVPTLHRRASEWYERNRLPADAIRHALACEDFERAADLAELAWPAWSGAIGSIAWRGWAKALPDEVVRARPVLSVAYAQALLNAGELEAAETQLLAAERWLEPATEPGERLGDPSTKMIVVDEEQFRSLPASLATARAYHAQATGNGPATVEYTQRALDLLPEEDHLRRASLTSLLGLSYWASGDLVAAHRTFSEGLAARQRAGDIRGAFGGTFVLADIKMALGHLHEAAGIYERALELATTLGGPVPLGTVDLYIGTSELHRERGELEAAAQDLATSKKLGEEVELPDWQYRWCIAQARLKATLGDLDSALDLLDEAERLYVRTPLPEVRPIAAWRTRIWVSQGRLAEALAWARERELSVDGDLSYLREFEHITLARVLIAQYEADRLDGTIREAMGLIERLLQAAEEGGRTGSVIEILVLQALAHGAQGNVAAALPSLERALALAEPEGYVRIFVDEGPRLARLLYEALSRGIASDYVRRLLAAFPVPEPEQPRIMSPKTHDAEWVEPLSERELEVLQLIAEGFTNREIAGRLFLSLNTVKVHTRNIYGKLGAHHRAEAVARARALGFLPVI